MSITIAKNAGFCFGVRRAVELVEEAAKSGKTVATLGPIIHNRHQVGRFEEMGVSVISEPEDAVPGSTVIIRSHGVSRAVQQRLEKMGVEIVDATCPFVKRGGGQTPRHHRHPHPPRGHRHRRLVHRLPDLREPRGAGKLGKFRRGYRRYPHLHGLPDNFHRISMENLWGNCKKTIY